MSSNSKLILLSGVMLVFFNYAMKVAITKKRILDFTVILSYVDKKHLRKYIGKASIMEHITSPF